MIIKGQRNKEHLGKGHNSDFYRFEEKANCILLREVCQLRLLCNKNMCKTRYLAYVSKICIQRTVCAVR